MSDRTDNPLFRLSGSSTGLAGESHFKGRMFRLAFVVGGGVRSSSGSHAGLPSIPSSQPSHPERRYPAALASSASPDPPFITIEAARRPPSRPGGARLGWQPVKHPAWR